MSRFNLILACLLLAASSPAAADYDSKGLKDIYFGEALYNAYQGEWFQAIARLDTELGQHRRLDEPPLDTLYYHLDQAEFGVGDFELGYRMHLRAGRAIRSVIEGNVEEPVRNDALYRLARLYFRKDQPEDALHALERIRGAVPEPIRDDVEFLRGQIFLANGRFSEAAEAFKQLQSVRSLEGFAGYNLGIASIKGGNKQEGRRHLDAVGQIRSDDPAALAIRDKSNLVLGSKLLDENAGENARLILERVRLNGPFSNRALLAAGWADASQGRYERALVPWSMLAEREVTDPAVQEALLAVPYAYGKLNIHGRAAVMYGKALDSFGREIDRLGASIDSVRNGKFLQALAREELKQDADWVVRLRSLPETPETYYLLELMASHDFQESLKNYVDLHELHRRLATWEADLDAFEDIIGQRRAYYQPLLPEIDRTFGELDSQIRLRLEQRDRVEKRLHALLTAPRSDHLATAEERIATEWLAEIERAIGSKGTTEKEGSSLLLPPNSKIPSPLAGEGQGGGEGASGEMVAASNFTHPPTPSRQGRGRNTAVPDEVVHRIARLRGILLWNISTEYDQRLTDAHKNLHDLNEAVESLKKQYDAFVRTRQVATQSYEGYDDIISRERGLIASAREKVVGLMARQGEVLETMTVTELTGRRERLEQARITARFAIADSYDRAAKAQTEERVGQ